MKFYSATVGHNNNVILDFHHWMLLLLWLLLFKTIASSTIMIAEQTRAQKFCLAFTKIESHFGLIFLKASSHSL